ncbi:MAG: hypothetical protein DHS20C09_21890 [marine bacterium B5-7]|nr:MAG: hypothetical protein DHS20C09_21890 [marine bacterium B5-7]
MARRLLIGILLSSLAWVLWDQASHSPESNSVTDRIEQPVLENDLNPAVSVSSQTNNPPIKTTENDGTENQLPATESTINQDLFTSLLAEVGEARYSDDPVIEMVSIMMEITDCGISRSFGRWSYLQPTAAWQQLNQQAADKCQQLEQQYPTIANDDYSEKAMELLTPTSMQGQQLMDVYKQLKQSSGDFTAFISDVYYLGTQSKNAQLIQIAKLFSTAGYGMANEVFPYQEILQTEDSQYIHLIDQLALELMACDFNQGVTCQAQSSTMLDRCKQVTEVCGLNFIQWFDAYVSAGIKADVTILSDYYKNLRP